jgi:hypothetical protein
MSERANDLASRLESVTEEMIATVEGMSDQQWMATCPADGRQVNVIVDHVSSTIDAVMPLAGMIQGDQPLPDLTMDMVHAGNAHHAQSAASIGKDECIAKFRTATANAAATIRGWSDADLDKSRDWSLMGPTSSVSLLENVVIGHAQGHLDSIRTVTAS